MQTRQELVLMFMLALVTTTAHNDPEYVLTQAGLLADKYLLSI
jgi:hypothetical protein